MQAKVSLDTESGNCEKQNRQIGLLATVNISAHQKTLLGNEWANYSPGKISTGIYYVYLTKTCAPRLDQETSEICNKSTNNPKLF